MFISTSFNTKANPDLFIENNSFYNINVKNSEPIPITINDLDNVTEFEAFVDSIIPQQLIDDNIVGATFSAVKDGNIFLTKGYGYRKRHPHIAVDPNSTLFRIGSISKTFTAIAVLQLVEDGLLNLDEDINEYLTAFQIPDTYPEPITLKHILTHTAGFEEWRVSIIIPTFSDVPDVEDLLGDYIPARVHVPGEISAYSNYGLGLAAYIVEEISGKAFDDYIHDEIAVPLGMNYTSFEQPLPPILEANMSDGYDDIGNIQYFENVLLPGAGACSSSAGDMAVLMLALLNNGTFNGGRILNNATVALMQENLFQPFNSSYIPGVGLGIYEFDVNDEHIIGHGGDTIYFHSRMALFPEHDFGFFISYNSQNGVYAKQVFFNEFIEEYFSKPSVVHPEHITSNLKDFNGMYLINRRLYNKYYTATPHIWFDYKFTVETNSTHLRVKEIASGFIQIDDDLFWLDSDYIYDFYIAFIRNEKGEVTHFYSNFFPSLTSYEKINTIYANNPMQLVFAIIIGVVYIIILASWGIDGLFRFSRKEEKRSRTERFSKWWVFGATIFSLIPLFYFAIKSQVIIFLDAGTKEALGWLIAFPYISTVLIAGLVIISGYNWYEFSVKSKGNHYRKTKDIDEIKIDKFLDGKSKKDKPLLKNIQFTTLAVFGVFIIVFFSVWRLYGF